jgi:CHAT domain-containing protein
MLGRCDEAVRLARKLEVDLRAHGAEEDAARALANLGSLHFRRDRCLEALDCYERAREILHRHGDPLFGAAIHINCANVLTQLNRIDEAIELYEEAASVYQQRGMTGEHAVVETNLGFLQHASGKPAVAVGHFSRAYSEFAQLGREQDAARCDIATAAAYRTLNLLPEALACCNRAIAAARPLGLEYERARAELCRGSTLIAMGQVEEGLNALACAEQVFRAQRNPISVAHVRLIRASLHRAEGRPDDARSEAKAAAAAFARCRLTGWAAEARFILAGLDLDQGLDAARRMHSVIRAARATHRGWLECRAEHTLGRWHATRGDLSQALRRLRAGVAALESVRTQISPEAMHVAYLRDKQAVYAELVGRLLERNTEADRVEALECAERARSRLLLERIQDALEGVAETAPSEALDSLRARVAHLRAELSRAQHATLHDGDGDGDSRRLAPAIPTAASALAGAEAAYLEATHALELQSPRQMGPDRAATVAELQQTLADDEALIQYQLLGDHVCAFVLTSESLHVSPRMASTAEVQALARRLRYHLQRMELAERLPDRVRATMTEEAQAVLRSLYDRLLAPIEAQVTGCRQLVAAPHGFLHGLPFHAFFDGQQYALDRWEILYAPSASIWRATVRHSGGQLPEAGRRRAPLLMSFAAPGIDLVTAEVEEVARLLPGAGVRHGAAANLEAFRQAAPEAGIVHLATHARFRQDNPLFSGLQLADGWLLARDLYEMRLTCSLATLSACHTGASAVEAGDELFGLVRGFLAAGATSVAASLWSAHDAATAQLMGRFYRELAHGESAAAALRCAQRSLRAEFPHPYYWAAFALIGRR